MPEAPFESRGRTHRGWLAGLQAGDTIHRLEGQIVPRDLDLARRALQESGDTRILEVGRLGPSRCGCELSCRGSPSNSRVDPTPEAV